MAKQIVFIGGGDSYSGYDDYIKALKNKPLRNPKGEKTPRWTDTFREKLGEDYDLYMLSMPNKDNAVFQEWSIWFERHFDYFKDDAILVGWSLGGMFLAKYLLEKGTPFTIEQLFLLAAPCGSFEDDTGNDCGSFQFDEAKLPILAKRVKSVKILHSKDDFVVPYEHALKYKEMLSDAELVTFEDKNHFLVEELPELLDLIK